MTTSNGSAPHDGNGSHEGVTPEWLAGLTPWLGRSAATAAPTPATVPAGSGLPTQPPVVTAPVTPTMLPHVPIDVPMPKSVDALTQVPDPGYYFLTDPRDSAPGLPGPGDTDLPGTLRAGPAGDPGLAAARDDFPALHQRVHGKPLVWLDNAATTQKPQSVIDAVSHYYEHDNSNVHRGAHTLAARATDAYEGARSSVAQMLGSPTPEQVVFVRGTTEGINLISQSLGRQIVGPGDEIVLTTLEHHANIVPWQMLAAEKGAKLRVVGVDDSGQVVLDDLARQLSPRTKIVAMSHVSNALGTILPIEQMIQMAHQAGAVAVVDGAQSVAHVPVDVSALDADFYVFSGHKIFGPTGIGAVYGKRELLDSMPPWQGGGSMIRDVTFEQTVYNDVPYKFEAGTPSIGDAVGLKAALDYVMGLGMHRIAAHEQALTESLMQTLGAIPGVRLIGTAAEKVGVASFVIDGVPTERIGTMLDEQGIAVRSGHHCAQPALRRFGLESTVRPSLAFYNNDADIESLGRAVDGIIRKLP
jgi:cysteine desulfurase/selenocysteine lyase